MAARDAGGRPGRPGRSRTSTWTTPYARRAGRRRWPASCPTTSPPPTRYAGTTRAVGAAVDALAEAAEAGATDIVGKALGRDELLGLVATYAAEKERLDVIDFGDQVALACADRRGAPEVVAIERSRYGLVVLDEYQDTGVAQRVLLSTLFAARTR